MKLIKSTFVKDVLALSKVEKDVEAFAQECLKNFVGKSTAKGVKRQNGGTVMPSDFFGVEGSGYVDSDAGTSMAPTADFLRPMINSTFKPLLTGGSCNICGTPAGIMQGGGNATDGFKVSMAAVKSVAPTGTSKTVLENKKEKFQELFGKALKKAARLDKEGGVLTKASLVKVVSSEKQFKVFL